MDRQTKLVWPPPLHGEIEKIQNEHRIVNSVTVSVNIMQLAVQI